MCAANSATVIDQELAVLTLSLDSCSVLPLLAMARGARSHHVQAGTITGTS